MAGIYAASQGSVQFPGVRHSIVSEINSFKKPRSRSRSTSLSTKNYFRVPCISKVRNGTGRCLLRRSQSSDGENCNVNSPLNRGLSVIRVKF
ncbi:hypothetical protein RRG08_057224 [Elysia crispata]|uniref:Uncharacterized protein n=1 Tax=Elysia crispata TaxID=231223 RepID=A0AAE0YLB4_9GAST|nr:hypothetical protein RRG08_057224 [Elysia crispata]